jgi:TetR/AcrR family transcriptional regulator
MSPGIDGSTKSKVMDAALRVFAEKGYAATSVRDIAALAGVTKPMVYYHFGSKAGLYQALLDQCLDISLEALKVASQGPTVREQLVRLIGTMLTLAQSNTDRIRVVVQTYCVAPGQIPQEIQYRDRLLARFDWLKGIVQAGIDAGEFKHKSADLMALAIMGQIHFLVTGMLIWGPNNHPGELPPLDRIAEAIVDLFLSGAENPERKATAVAVAGVA